MYTITIYGELDGKTILRKVQPYQTLLEVCLNHHIGLAHQCGGICHCTTCHVYVVKGMDFLETGSKREKDFLTRLKNKKPTSRLACQSLLMEGKGEIEVVIPEQMDV